MFRVVLIILVGLLYACGAVGASEQSTKQITEADNGRTIELRVGDKLEVTLPGNPTTGFQWEVSNVDSLILTPIGEPEFKPSSNAVGSGGNVILRFEAVGAGQTELKLIHHRPFEENVAPIQTFEVTVTVK